MSLTINTNVSSLNAQRNLGFNNQQLNKSMEKLASGFRINRAADDAAGLQLSENLRADTRGSAKALQNVQDGINMLNYLDGQYQAIGDHMQRMRELAVQAANDTNSYESRNAILQEFRQRTEAIIQINQGTTWNGVRLMGFAVAPQEYYIQAGNDATSDDVIDIASVFGDATVNNGFGHWDGLAMIGLPYLTMTRLDDHDGWQQMLYADSPLFGVNMITQGPKGLDIGIEHLNVLRGRVGAMVNRLESAAENLQISMENVSAAESRIRNVDVANESAELTRNQILQQSATAMLTQANSVPSIALQLLQQ